MRYPFVCIKCLEDEFGKLAVLSPDEYLAVILERHWVVDQPPGGPAPTCQQCGGLGKRVFIMADSYVRGYGYADKRGAKNDMNLHLMVTGQDPYGKQRNSSDSKDIVERLRRNKEHNPRSRDIYT